MSEDWSEFFGLVIRRPRILRQDSQSERVAIVMWITMVYTHKHTQTDRQLLAGYVL